MDTRTDDHSLEALRATSSLDGANAAWLEALYESWLRDPGSVPEAWRVYFDDLAHEAPAAREALHSEIRAAFRDLRTGSDAVARAVSLEHERKQVRVLQIIDAYRFLGHFAADLDPLGLAPRPDLPELTLAHHGLDEADLDTVFNTGSLASGNGTARLRDIVATLRATYCRTVGVEYMHIQETAEKRWLQQRIEGAHGRFGFTATLRRELLERLTAAEGLERYLHTRYVGQKRFSLEGAESLIPLLDALVRRAGMQGVKEIVVGMAHRGRLNVLVNLLGKSPAEVFGEFEGRHREGNGTGDVKYHQGFSSDVQTPGGPLHLALAFNPSHLEIVGPVVEGSVRARQERRGEHGGPAVLPVVVHGDAAFAGQGVVMETFSLSQTHGFRTYGTVRIVVNNQIGFTTSASSDARSTHYCTDIAKMVGAPILHVNGDDPEAVLFVTQIALDYRMHFGKDVVIDLVCYRRQGHNEADEPAVTQPLMYRRIRELPTTRALYAERLVAEDVLAPEEPARMEAAYRERLDRGEIAVPNLLPCGAAPNPYATDWTPYLGHEWDAPADTRLPLARLRELWARMSRIPDGFELHPRVARILDDRARMAAGALPIDWGFAENMAYAALVADGFPVRLCGQDCGRGTFFHRHAAIYNQRDGVRWIPLEHVAEDQARFSVVDSLLSEEAVLAFEYGYATAEPRGLVIWEAQFGDFANNAQVVIDQFISSGEQKWGRLCGLTLLLPHGYEGQGPEHSSARLERYLQLCAQQNMQVCVPSTPAQVFHLLRRQAIRPYRKPLIALTPKSLLRHRLAVSSLEALCDGSFQVVLDDVDAPKPAGVRRVLLCAGKVYYDLLERRRELDRADVAILRIEQLYPFPGRELAKALAAYPRAKEIVWVQEEPLNQGAWYSILHHLKDVLGDKRYPAHVTRPAAAAPAAGHFEQHVREQQELVERAFA